MYAPTWSDPLGTNAWTDLSWPGQEMIKESLVSLVAFDHRRTPKCIGTGFLVSSRGKYAVCVTAAHNLYAGVSMVQYPNRSHPSTPPEFIPNFERVNLDRSRFWAIYQKAGQPETCVVTEALWDKRADIAFLTIEYQEPSDRDFVQGEWMIDETIPAVDQLIGVLGWADMHGEVASNHPVPSGTIERRLALRVGRVLSIESEGAMRSGASVISTIPVTGGMSGGPAFIWRSRQQAPAAFGFISSDPETGDANAKANFENAGCSTIGILPVESIASRGEDRIVRIKLDCSDQIVRNDR